jgi:mRNA interferase HigB
MDLVNAVRLDQAARRHPQTKGWLDTWRQVVQAAAWTSLVDVRKTYPAADGVPIRSGRFKIVITVFNVGGNDYRLLCVVNYRAQRVTVLNVLTHAEYSKNQWKNL